MGVLPHPTFSHEEGDPASQPTLPARAAMKATCPTHQRIGAVQAPPVMFAMVPSKLRPVQVEHAPLTGSETGSSPRNRDQVQSRKGEAAGERARVDTS